jgi:hypothetical protein
MLKHSLPSSIKKPTWILIAILYLKKRYFDMAYTVLGERDAKWQPRKGLEGPFYFATGRVLYYDVREGQYYDPTTDFYVEKSEMDLLHAEMARMLSR